MTHLAAPARAAGDLLHRRVDGLPPVLLRVGVGGGEGVPAVAPLPPAPAGEAPPPLRPPGPARPLLTPDTGHHQAEEHHGHTPGHHHQCGDNFHQSLLYSSGYNCSHVCRLLGKCQYFNIL